MTILVTGGAGFIGSHLCAALLRDGDHSTRILVLDSFTTGARENLARLTDDPRLQIIEGDVVNAPLVDELVARCDAVYHLAAAVGVRRVLERPVETVETNVMGTHAVLSACVRRKTPVLMASTSEVYGKNAHPPFKEDDDSVLGSVRRARWGYACSKLLDEFLSLAYAREYGLPVVIARLFNTVGPRQTGRYGMVVPSFVRLALAGEPLIVHGDGSQSRCFTHVSDAVRAIIGLLNTTAAHGEVFNVGGTQEVSIRRLAERVIELTGSDSPLQLVPYEEAFEPHIGFEDMPRRVPDTSKLRRTLGFAPDTSLDDILRDVIADMKG